MLICRITPFEEHYNIDLKMENIINGKIIASSSQVVDQNIIDIINSMPPMIIDLISQQYPDSKIENKVPNVPIRSRKIKENINSNSKSTVKIEKGPIQNIVSDEKSLIVITTSTNISINNDVYAFNDDSGFLSLRFGSFSNSDTETKYLKLYPVFQK